TDQSGVWTRVDDSARLTAQDLGLATDPQTLADEGVRRAIARRLATVAADYILDAPRDALGAALALTEPFARTQVPAMLTVSVGPEHPDSGDIARLFPHPPGHGPGRRPRLPLTDPGGRIRATVIGASQFTVQVSGKTIHLPDPDILPVHNVPVVHLTLDLAG